MKLLLTHILSAQAAFSALPKAGQRQFNLFDIDYNPTRDVPELMKSMNFTNWESDDYYQLYDQLVQALDPAYQMPQTALMGDLSAGWSDNFNAIKLECSLYRDFILIE